MRYLEDPISASRGGPLLALLPIHPSSYHLSRSGYYTVTIYKSQALYGNRRFHTWVSYISSVFKWVILPGFEVDTGG